MLPFTFHIQFEFRRTTPILNGSPTEEIPNTPEEQPEIDERLTRPLQHEYNMKHKNRGIAFIFNHAEFDDLDAKRRNGSSIDGNRLKTTLDNLGFEVKTFNDQSVKGIGNILRECK